MTPELSPDQIVDVILETEESTLKLSSRILEVGPRGFAIFRPMLDGALISISKRLQLTFRRGNVIWTLNCPVLATVSMRIDLGFPEPENVHRVARREHLRVPLTMPMDYQLPNGERWGRMRQGVLQDLSGGGCLLLLSEELSPGGTLKVHLSMEAYGLMELKGRIIRVVPAEKRNEGRWLVAIEFYPISERDRDQLVKFVFNKHREEVIRLKQRAR